MTMVELVERAAKARSDLNIFAAIQQLMEGSLVSAPCFDAEHRIVKIAKAEQAKCLSRYDEAIAALRAAAQGETQHD